MTEWIEKTGKMQEVHGNTANAQVVIADNLHKVYRMGDVKVPALNGIDLRITSGDFVAIIGPSGSGKSTLLNLLGMLDVPTRGRLLIAGSNTSELTSNDRARFRLKNITFIFQFFNLFLELSAFENVMLPAMLSGDSFAKCRAQALDLLDQVGMADRAGHKPGQLSGGQQQRVSIARALINNPMLLLADEPTAHLDSTRAREVMGLLARLNHEMGLTIVLVTHEMEYCSFARRTIALKDGQVDNTGTSEKEEGTGKGDVHF